MVAVLAPAAAAAAAAAVAGMKGYTAISGWVKDVPLPVLSDLYMRAGARPARPPSKATIWRVITDADAEVSGATAGGWLIPGHRRHLNPHPPGRRRPALLLRKAPQARDEPAGHRQPRR